MGFLLAANGLLVLFITILVYKKFYGKDWDLLFEAITGYGLEAPRWPCSGAWEAGSTPRLLTSALTWSGRWSRTSPRMTLATRRLRPSPGVGT